MKDAAPLLSLRRRLLLLSLSCLLLLPLLLYSPWLQRLNNTYGDSLIRLRAGTQQADPRLLLIDIDDRSLQALSGEAGKWPWPRSLHAELLDYLLARKPAAVAFDILFSEADLHNPDADTYFNEVLAGTSRVYLSALQQQSSEPTSAPLLQSYPPSLWQAPAQAGQQDARALLLLPWAVPAEHWRSGLINLNADADGVARRHRPYTRIGDWQLPSLPAHIAHDLGLRVPQSEWLIDWPGAGRFPHERISYAELLAHARGLLPEATAPPLHNRVIVIGSTASGLHDLRRTPLDGFYPAPFILTSALDNLLNQRQLRLLGPAPALVVGLGLLLAVALLLWLERLRAAALLYVCASLVLLGASVWLALQAVLFIPLAVLLTLTAQLAGALLLYYQRRRQQLDATVAVFNRFMDPQVVKQLLAQEDPDSLLASRECQLTVLFSDIRNFTTLSEQHSASEIMQLLEHYFGDQVEVLFRHHATLDKFIGDAIMAFWGAPLDNPTQAVDAVQAALDMLDNLDRFRRDFNCPDFAIGIGIHTGPAVVGLVGARQRYDYTAIGDTVNLASRIEGVTKGRASLLVSASTREACGDRFEFIAHGQFQVKGRHETVELFEPRRKP